MYKHAYTLYSAVRPFGCAVALGSYDEVDGPQLFMVDPSGVSFVSQEYILRYAIHFVIGAFY